MPSTDRSNEHARRLMNESEQIGLDVFQSTSKHKKRQELVHGGLCLGRES